VIQFTTNYRTDRPCNLLARSSMIPFDNSPGKSCSAYYANDDPFQNDVQWSVAFPPTGPLQDSREIISSARLKQLHIAERSVPHVTSSSRGEEPSRRGTHPRSGRRARATTISNRRDAAGSRRQALRPLERARTRSSHATTRTPEMVGPLREDVGDDQGGRGRSTNA